MACNKNHRYNPIFGQLNDSQGGEERHLCCGCAFEQGFKDGFSNEIQNFRPSEISDSQAGNVRHKDASQAYEWGYKLGVSSR